MYMQVYVRNTANWRDTTLSKYTQPKINSVMKMETASYTTEAQSKQGCVLKWFLRLE